MTYGFLRQALAACAALSLGAGPIGTFLILRRMSLMGDAMSHAILPGVAIGFLVAGLDLWAMSLGGFAASLIIALLAGAASRFTVLREDASLAGFYLISLALGVLIISMKGSSIDLLHVLFGTLLAVDGKTLVLLASVATLTLLALAVFYRTLVAECFDPVYLRSVGGAGVLAHFVFLALVVLNLVAGVQALGTLMAVGLMMLPATAARLWAHSIGGAIFLASAIAFLSSIAGLLISYHFSLPSGPAIILLAGFVYIFSLLTGKRGGLLWRFLPQRHLEH